MRPTPGRRAHPLMISEILDQERAAWSRRFGGGMIPFDNAYEGSRRSGHTIAECQRVGVNALLDAFVNRVKERLDEEDIS